MLTERDLYKAYFLIGSGGSGGSDGWGDGWGDGGDCGGGGIECYNIIIISSHQTVDLNTNNLSVKTVTPEKWEDQRQTLPSSPSAPGPPASRWGLTWRPGGPLTWPPGRPWWFYSSFVAWKCLGGGLRVNQIISIQICIYGNLWRISWWMEITGWRQIIK